MDCGAACVKMVANYYGKQPPIEFLENLCQVGTEGVSMKGICTALDRLGFRTVAGKITLENLRDKALLPCILHWNQNHFVVLYKIRKRRGGYRYMIADPGMDLVEYSEKEFKDSWISTNSSGEDKGSAILLEPGPSFLDSTCPKEEKKRPKQKLAFLWEYFKKYRKYFVQLLFGLLVCSSIILVSPFLTQSIVDVGIEQKSLYFILLVLIGQTLLLFGRTIIDFVQSRLLLHIGARINISLLSDFFIKILRLPMSFFDIRLVGDIMQRIEDHKQIQNFLTRETIGLTFSLLTFIVFGVVLCIYSLPIFLVFIVFSFIYGIWLLFFLKKRRTLNYKYFEQQANNQTKTYQLINSAQETKIHGAENRKRWEWEDIQADLFVTGMDILKLQQSQSAGGILINELRNICITVIAAASVINNNISLGMMVAIQFILGELSYPIERIMTFIYQWQDVSISLDRIEIVHGQDEENIDRPVASFPSENRSITVDNMTFRYPGIREENVLRNISLTIPQGKTTAIVGTSGSGKTTLVKLLLGFYNEYSGTIKIGDMDLKDVNLDWWRSNCGVVMQNGFIYSDTIAGNIAASETYPDQDRLQYAANISDADSFINSLPLKYNTMIGEGGQGISQGQRQRILIARAVYKDPDYLFLDEATNSLDANTERRIVRELDEFYKGRTVVVIAHRLSTVKNADQILVLSKGRIVERGTHELLIARRGAYYELIKNQLELDD